MANEEITKILNAAARLLVKNQSVNILFEQDVVKIKLPTTRDLAKDLNTPHYYILPGFSLMEKNKLIKREERVGIWTTNEGTRILLSLLKDNYVEETKNILGEKLFTALTEKINTGLSKDMD
ncbi:hypothetical protein F1737_00865 [Methanoplanus sp. FWC-SCC4]|uniref:DNA-binding protein n=1 Tax=Methanochimaera problematica TaxID=2609417 RepID=A0AA97I3K7_9EURY|nr:hypothetical protein [Methanoplanus sp. FWC-SCC4]WOF15331.1 hypothetical protein F1737_00865 [Methanoplanus sp. FWC-SCC4]